MRQDKGQGHDIQARTRSADYGIPRLEHKRQLGSERRHWLQPAEKPGAQGRRRGQEDFGLNVAYGLQEGPALSCQGLRAQLAQATVNWTIDNSYFEAELWGLLAFVMFGASKHHTRLI